MGGYLTKQMLVQGYYPDMSRGYLTDIGGRPTMIRYPSELARLADCCPLCSKSSGLMLPEMRIRLDAERKKFEEHTNSIIAARMASGERDPYPYENRSNNSFMAKQKGSFSLFKKMKQSSISPSVEDEPSGEDRKNPFYYKVHLDDIIVCKCMNDKGADEDELQEEYEACEVVTVAKKHKVYVEESQTDEDQVNYDGDAGSVLAEQRGKKYLEEDERETEQTF